jgi:RND family efflux transporter MFP subunit
MRIFSTRHAEDARTNTARVVLAGVLLCSAAVLGACREEKAPPAAPLTPVTVAEATTYNGIEGVNYSASIVPYQQLNVSFKSGGYVTSILQKKGVDGRVRNAQMGDWVKRGEVLATVRQSDYQQAVDQYKGTLEQAKASATNAQQTWTRAQALYKANAMTQTDYDSAKAQFDASQGQVATAQAGVAQAQQALDDCAVRAPLDGQILARNIELGVLVGAGTSAFTMGETQNVKAVFGVPDTVLSAVKLGQKQAVRTESYTQPFMGLVTAIAPQADSKSRTFQVEVTLPNPGEKLKSGMVATLVLGQAPLGSPAVVVPISAIVAGPNGSRAFTVYVLEHSGDKDVARQRTVTPGAAYGNLVAISNGLSAGDRVILNGSTLVKDGEAVRVIP